MRAGLGLAVLPDFLAAGPDCVRVLAPDEVFSDGVWLVMHADLAASARVRAVADFLAEAVTAHAALAGRPDRGIRVNIGRWKNEATTRPPC